METKWRYRNVCKCTFCQCYQQLPQCDERYYIATANKSLIPQPDRHHNSSGICSTKNKVCRFHHEVDGRCECGDLLSFFDVRSNFHC
ncbi:hypothetical protein CY34DRAFT_801117 [Suillus luteus UH-Slu-Lm8-n1]|uniref:Uncharacterized protein n=1 Tax=Suillus luteus UH-Slu-Lm8-n1 TaxID=930992 RepID=A0A0D0B7I8_9AGAM|nr:hypothetical protein CY34DRAFT_801117 [Suillus luteus UH-Slu-Lm8-n1]